MDEKIIAASKRHPIVALGEGRLYAYGTAGFRMKADLLGGVTFRVGLLAALRTRKMSGKAIGVMITASHNPAADNGVKVIDPMGEMLEQDWEALATKLVNCPTDEELVAQYRALAEQLNINLDAPGRVVYGRDTRPSSPPSTTPSRPPAPRRRTTSCSLPRSSTTSCAASTPRGRSTRTERSARRGTTRSSPRPSSGPWPGRRRQASSLLTAPMALVGPRSTSS